MSKTLIVGDLHLGKSLSLGKPGLGSMLNTRIADQINLLNWILDQILEYNVETLILTGDINEDVKPDYAIVNILFYFLKKCEIYNVDVHIVAGNHDLKRTGSHYTSVLDLISTLELPHVSVYKQIHTLHKKDVCFTFMPFRDRRSLNKDTHNEAVELLQAQLPYELADIPPGYDKVLIGHLALEGSLFVGDEIDDFNNEIMCPLSMFNGYDYVWMGHIHRPQTRSQIPYIAHVGSLDISDFGEVDHTKIVILYDTNNPIRFTEIKIPTRPLRKIDLTIPLQFDPTLFVLEQIEVMHKVKSFERAIVKIELHVTDPYAPDIDRESIEQALYQKYGAFYICNFFEHHATTIVSLSKQNLIDNTVDPKAAIKLFADQLIWEFDDDKHAYIESASSIIDKHKSGVK